MPPQITSIQGAGGQDSFQTTQAKQHNATRHRSYKKGIWCLQMHVIHCHTGLLDVLPKSQLAQKKLFCLELSHTHTQTVRQIKTVCYLLQNSFPEHFSDAVCENERTKSSDSFTLSADIVLQIQSKKRKGLFFEEIRRKQAPKTDHKTSLCLNKSTVIIGEVKKHRDAWFSIEQ